MLSLIYQLLVSGPTLYCQVRADQHTRLLEQALSKTSVQHFLHMCTVFPFYKWKKLINSIL